MSKSYQSNDVENSFVPSPAQPGSPLLLSGIRHWRLVGALVLVLLMAACGPESSSASNDQLTADVQRIAQEYQASGNLDAARSQIDGLAVANPNQWLIFVTESSIDQNGDPNTLAALVKLTTDLGLESVPITEYGVQNNLLAALVAADPPVAEAPAPTVAPTAVITTSAAVTVSSPATLTAALTPTAQAVPMAKASDLLNVRGGPGTNYNILGGLQKDELVQIVGKSPAGDWWQVKLTDGQQGWLMGELVEVLGDASAVAVAADIPAAPAPVAEVPAPAEAAVEAPVAEAPAEAPAETAPDPNAAPHFTLVSKRLWNKDENDGCVGKHLLRINVLDAAGNRLNGIRLKGIYTGEEIVTGDQGKGDGVIEFDLHGSGEGFKVIRNNDGREATSDPAEGFTTRSVDLPEDVLIQSGYCSNHEDCTIFYNSWGCQGHHSWEAIFQRNY